MDTPADNEVGLLPIRPTPLLPLKRSESQIKKMNETAPTRRRSANADSDTFTRNQLSFINFYCQGMSAKAAFIKAGYSPTGSPSGLLYTPHVFAEIQRQLRIQFEAQQITTNEVMEGFARDARANVLDYGEVQADGSFRFNLNNISRDMGASIEELGYDSNGRLKVQLANKAYARMNLARLMGLFVDKHEVSGKDGGPLTLQALDSIVINTTINQQINISATPDRQQLPENVDTIEAIVSNNSRPVIDAELPLNI